MCCLVCGDRVCTRAQLLCPGCGHWRPKQKFSGHTSCWDCRSKLPQQQPHQKKQKVTHTQAVSSVSPKTVGQAATQTDEVAAHADGHDKRSHHAGMVRNMRAPRVPLSHIHMYASSLTCDVLCVVCCVLLCVTSAIV
jgi:hypothetical protein